MTSVFLSQQPFQPAYHGLEENSLNEDQDASISDYQLDPKPSSGHTFLEEKRIDQEMLKEKNRNFELRHAMTCSYSFWSRKIICTHAILIDEAAGKMRDLL